MTGDQTDSSGDVQELDASQAPVNSESQLDSETQPGNSLENEGADQVSGLSEDQIRETVRHEFQTLKDKRFAKIESTQQETTDRLDQYEAYRASGLEPAQAKRELAVDALIAAQEAPVVQQPVNSGLTADDAQALASSSLKSVPEEIRNAVLEDVNTKAFPNAESLQNFVMEKSVSHASKPKGSSATSATQAIGVSKSLAEGAELLGEYTEKVMAARGKPDEIRELKDSYRERGLEVDQVVFTS